VVITLERYFKIVHAIAHRKYYREPEILSQLDDVGGGGAAVGHCNVPDPVSGNGHNQNRERPLFENGCLAERSHGFGKHGCFFLI